MKPDWDLARPGTDDWRDFLTVAGAENWKVPVTERKLLQGPLADSAMALRCSGRFGGMVTYVSHGVSGWIGNLIVCPSLRGLGFGRLLFGRALRELADRKTSSVWLTASESGYHLYRKRGFATVGRIERWVLSGRGADMPQAKVPVEAEKDAAEELLRVDAGVWNGRRPLLDHLLPLGRLFSCGGSLALLQREKDLQILGPWYDVNASSDEQRGLLAKVNAARGGEELVADIRAGAVAPEWLEEAGFVRRGENRLMVLGDRTAIRLENLVSLASLGSMG